MRETNNSTYALLPLLVILIFAVFSCGPKNPSTDIEISTFSETDLEPKDRAYYHFTVSRLHFLNKNFGESLRELEITESYDPDSAFIKYNLALMYISSGRLSEALDKLEKSIELDPNFAPSFTILGKVYASSQDKDHKEKSVKILKRAIDLNPDDVESLLFLGIIETEAGNFDSAEKHFKKIIELYPENERGFFFLARLYYEKGDLINAERLYNESLKLNPSFISALIELALVYERQGRFEESENIYKSIITLYPETLNTYVRYGNFLFRISRKADAKEQFEKAENLDYRNPDLKLRLGLLYIEDGDFEKAIEEFQLILLGNPNDQRAKYYLALSYIETEKYEEGLTLLNAIGSEAEFYEASLVQKAYIYEKKGDLNESLRMMEKVYRNQPNNELIVNYLGSVYRKLNQDQDAI